MRVAKKAPQAEISTSKGQLTELFLRSREIDGCSTSTIQYYRQFLGYFLAWLGDREIEAVAVDDYKFFLLRKKRPDGEPANRSTSVNTHLRAIKSFVFWASNQGLLQGFTIKPVREKNTLSRALPLPDIRKLLDATKIEGFEGKDARGRTYKGGRTRVRDAAIIWLLFETGMRPGELCSIDLEDVKLGNNTIRVDGKTGQRDVPFTCSRKPLLAYIRHRSANPGVFSFFTLSNGEPMTVNALKKTFARLGKIAGVKHASPYKMRHSCAIEYIRAGASVTDVMVLFGHSRISTTQRYMRTVLADVVRMQKEHNPANRLK